MVSKWADYLISAVRYDDEETHIVRVRAHPDLGDIIGASDKPTRESVVRQIMEGTTFATVCFEDEKWILGAKVELVEIDGTTYIKTVPDQTKRDNLGELPRF